MNQMVRDATVRLVGRAHHQPMQERRAAGGQLDVMDGGHRCGLGPPGQEATSSAEQHGDRQSERRHDDAAPVGATPRRRDSSDGLDRPRPRVHGKCLEVRLRRLARPAASPGPSSTIASHPSHRLHAPLTSSTGPPPDRRHGDPRPPRSREFPP